MPLLPTMHQPPQRLDSWKDIAAYLKRDVSTVQRWEKREGMPVHRHQHDKLGSVYAFPDELDGWARSRRASPEPQATEPGDPAAAPDTGRRRRPILWLAAAAIALIALSALIAAVYGFLSTVKKPAQNPIESARFVRLTDFEGLEQAAAISRDGRFVAFLSDRDGLVDVWVTQIGTGQFLNLTRGKVQELVNPDIRTLGFSPDGALVSFWVRRKTAAGTPDISVWAIPTLGGEPRPYLEGAAELDWSRDGSRLVYHTPAPGDPMLVRDRDGASARTIFTGPNGIHNHYQLWSADGRWIYFVKGTVPAENDVWRIDPGGGSPERMTSHNTRVTYPAFLDARTLLYLATEADGGGPWLYALDPDRRQSRRVSFGLERYTSLASSADGKRLVVTVADPRRTLWRVPIGLDASETKQATRIAVATIGARAPRMGPGYLLCASSRSDSDSIWKLSGETASQLWSAAGALVIGGPAISRDGKQIAFAAEQRGKARLHVMRSDGSGVRTLSESLQPRGAPAWSPDGQSLAVAAAIDGEQQLVRVSLAGGAITRLVKDFAAEPVWSSDGNVIVFSGREVGTTFPIHSVGVDGRMRSKPAMMLSRGVRRVVFLPGQNSLVVLRGDMVHKDFWAIDVETGRERRLTNFKRDIAIGDFDVSPDGREIVFDREQDNSDIGMIEPGSGQIP